MENMSVKFGFAVAFALSVTVSTTSFAAKTLVNCIEGSPSFLNPQLVADGASTNMTRNMYTNLVDFKPGSTEVVPALAESWEISKDGLTYTFKLRKNVSFHTTPYFTPTRKFNADDVLFSINRQRLKDHPFHKLAKGYEFFDSLEMGKIIKDVVKVDDYTVKFILSRPEAPFLADLGIDFAAMLSAEYADNLMKKGTPEKIDFDPVGTGPFTFVRYDKDQTVRMKAFPEFWGGKVKIDNLIYSITPDPSVRFQKLKTGECHFVAEPSPVDLDAIKKDPNLKVMERASMSVGMITFNASKKPFDNVLVRRAIAHAVNIPAYLDAIYLGHAMRANNPMPPVIWSHNGKVKATEYSPEKAKALLKQAGLPNGFESELTILPVSRPYNPNGKKMGEMMQADLEKVGIKLKIVSYDWPTFLAKTRVGDHQIMQYGWMADNGDPDNFLHYLFACASMEGGGNRSKWCNPDFDKIVNKAKIVSDKAERTKLYMQAQVFLHDQMPAIPIAHAVMSRAMSKKVEGYQVSPFGKDFFGYADLK